MSQPMEQTNPNLPEKPTGMLKPTKGVKPQGLMLPRLAPLDHIRNLYAGAVAELPAGKQRKILQKRDMIQAIRHMSPVKSQAMEELTRTQKLRKSGGSTGALASEAADSTTRAIKELEASVNHNARKYNELKQTADKKERQLKKLKDQLRELSMENEALSAMHAKQTPEQIRIEKLKSEISKVEGMMSDKNFRKRQLEHMAERLKTNQILFDGHIKGMDNALKASQKELTEVKTYLRMLEASKDKTIIELHKFQNELAEQKAAREKELHERELEATNARRMDDWRKQRESQRAEMAAQLRGDLSLEQERILLNQLKEKEEECERLKAASKERAAKALTLEEAFLAIRQATGVTTLEEMVEKFLGQGANKEALEKEKAEAESKLAKAKAAKAEAEAQFAEMKASGLGGTELSREVYEQMEAEIAEARTQLKVQKASCDRLENILVAVRQGAVGLIQRLAPFDPLLEDEGGSSKQPLGSSVPKTLDSDSDDEEPELGSKTAAVEKSQALESLQLLSQCEKKLNRMLDMMGSSKRGPVDDDDERFGSTTRSRRTEDEQAQWAPAANNDPVMHENNIRVLPSTYRDPDGGIVGPDDEEDDEPMDRTALKGKSISKFAEEVRKREVADRRAAMAAKIHVNEEKKEIMQRLTTGHVFETTGLTFITQKPDLM